MIVQPGKYVEESIFKFYNENECARNGQDEPGLNSLPENVSK